MRYLANYLDHFRSRVLQDALTDATAAYWLRRAQAFDEAAPRPGDDTGGATPAELDERRQRCEATARACRAHAGLLRGLTPERVSDDVRRVLVEVA